MNKSLINSILKELEYGNVYQIDENKKKPLKIGGKNIKGITLGSSNSEASAEKLRIITSKIIKHAQENDIKAGVIEKLFPEDNTITIKLGKNTLVLLIEQYSLCSNQNISSQTQDIVTITIEKSHTLIKIGMD